MARAKAKPVEAPKKVERGQIYSFDCRQGFYHPKDAPDIIIMSLKPIMIEGVPHV
jgi:hypothetical protein